MSSLHQRSPRFLLCALTAALLALALSSSAQAKITISSLTTTASENQAGGHPDLTTSFELANPGAPEAAKDVIFEAPEGIFGNPNALTRCTASDFALQQCPVNSQAGLVTITAKQGADPNVLLGTAPLFDMEPSEGETARFNLIVPTLNIPIAIPVAVRSADDYGLRFTRL